MDRGCDKDMDDLHIKMSDALDSCKRRMVGETCLSGSVGQDTVCTDRDGLSEEPGFNSPGRPVDFVFGFQGHMLGD